LPFRGSAQKLDGRARRRADCPAVPVIAATWPSAELAPGNGEVTLKQVAEAAGVHPGTASRALADDPDTRGLVKEDTARRVLEAARELGYLRNAGAASLRTHRTCTIGVLVADLADPLDAALARGAEDYLTAAEYMAMIRSTGGDGAQALAAVSQMRAHHADGLILAAGCGNAVLAGGAKANRWPPGAVWAGSLPPTSELDAVSADHAAGIRMIMDHLAMAGHRNVGCVTGPGAAVSEQDLAAAAAAAGLAAPACLTGKALSPVEGRRCARSILTAGTACTAIVTTSDLLAAGCCRAIAEAGLACPQDVSVTGFGDLPLAGWLQPPLTTVRLPQYRVGTAAAKLLLGRITKPPRPARTMLMEPKLVTRTSSGPPPTGRRP
jgi:LacI family transcriptional regulator